MESEVTHSEDDGDDDFRLGHFRDGVSVATIRWIDMSSVGLDDRSPDDEHVLQTSEEAEAAALLAWIARHDDTMLISKRVRY